MKASLHGKAENPEIKRPQKSFTLGLSVEIPNVLLAKALIITGLKDYVWSQKITKIWLVDELASALLERRVRSP